MKEESTNDVKTRTIESIITQLSTKGDNFEKSAPYIYLSENSRPNTLCETTMTINSNTYDKYKVPSKYKTANELTTKWLQHMCGIWCIIFIELIVQNLHLHPKDSSIHSSNHTRGDPILTNAEFKKNYYRTQASKGQTQPQIGNMELTIYEETQKKRESNTTTILVLKAEDTSNFEFYSREQHKVQTTTQGRDFLVNPFTTYKNDTHVHNKGTINPKGLSKQNVTA